jgi:modification methylase
MDADIIYTKNCSSMDEVLQESVDLIITGPPYWRYIDYSAYVDQKEFVWPKGNSYESYFEDLKKWFTECFRVLRKGRYCIINLGTVRKDGRCYAIPFHSVPVLEDIGFEFCFEIIWHKISGGRRHARGIIQHPYPGYYIPNNRTEYLLVFRKDSSTPFYEEKSKLKTKKHQIEIDDFFKKQVANNVWYIMPPCFPLNGKHPCPFPPEIPYRLIPLFSTKGEIVLDPFMGIGTTARAARMLGRRFIGYEIQQSFVDIALASIDEPLQIRNPTICHYDTLNKKDTSKNKKIHGKCKS